MLNALAAIAIGLELELPFSAIAAGLSAFEGVGRRLEIKGEKDGVTVIDDYGHHPTEVRATLAALRARYPTRRIVTLFQPHRYSRTQSLWNDFAQSFGDTIRSCSWIFTPLAKSLWMASRPGLFNADAGTPQKRRRGAAAVIRRYAQKKS